MKAIQGKPGDKVNIYQDPLTKKKLEGIATLKRFQGKNDFNAIEAWEVQFDGEAEIFVRSILY